LTIVRADTDSNRSTMTDYYSRHPQGYYAETVDIDPEPFLGSFARRLHPGDRVLDVGCGSGRDLRWLRRKGMAVTGFERSAGLAGLARSRSGCRVIEGDFRRYDFSALAVDAVVLCGALVHIAHDRLPGILADILNALAPASPRRLAYLSLKAGQGAAADERGRMFYFWRQTELDSLLTGMGLTIREAGSSPSADGSGQPWLGYVVHCPDEGGTHSVTTRGEDKP
jgi:SAM-dependent methyltransferase